MMTRFISAMIMALAMSAMCYGVPASNVTREVRQPDGSVVSLTLVGDEHFHFYLTSEGEPVVRQGNGYYYACVDELGQMKASGFLAGDLTAQRPILSAKDMTRAANYVNRVVSEAARRQKPVLAEDICHVGRFPNCTYPTRGEVNALVLLVEYPDMSFSKSDEEINQYFTDMLNKRGFDENGATGSCRDWFDVASGGVFKPVFDVAGPIMLPSKRSYYGFNQAQYYEPNAYKMLPDAIDILAGQGFDFSRYDNDGDGVVDSVFIFFAGYGEASSGVEEAVWPHSASLAQIYGNEGYAAGDVLVDTYACTNELLGWDGSQIDGIGTFLHEYSHVLGLPDLYSTYNMMEIFTPSTYSILDSGVYNNESRTPPTYSSFERYALGWLEPETLQPGVELSLENLHDSNSAYIIPTLDSREFFLIENRQRTGWDSYLPGHGMLVWHIDYDEQVWDANIVNTEASHQHVDLVEAGGRIDNSSLGLKSYPFPGLSNVRVFADYTSPSMIPWCGESVEMPITDICETDNGLITAKIGSKSGVFNLTSDANCIVVKGNEISAVGMIYVYDFGGRLVTCGEDIVTVNINGFYMVVVEGGVPHKILIKS